MIEQEQNTGLSEPKETMLKDPWDKGQPVEEGHPTLQGLSQRPLGFLKIDLVISDPPEWKLSREVWPAEWASLSSQLETRHGERWSACLHREAEWEKECSELMTRHSRTSGDCRQWWRSSFG